MTEHHFKKGDPVPEWVEKIEPAGIDLHFFFGVDVLVERYQHGAVVYPLQDLLPDECLMLAKGEGTGAWITGGPTFGFTYPKGDPRIVTVSGLMSPKPTG